MMTRTGNAVLGGGVALALAAGGYGALRAIPSPTPPPDLTTLQQQVETLTERLEDTREWSRASDAQIAIQRGQIAQLRLEVDALPKPGAKPHDPDRHEQRIGNLEYDRYGEKPPRPTGPPVVR